MGAHACYLLNILILKADAPRLLQQVVYAGVDVTTRLLHQVFGKQIVRGVARSSPASRCGGQLPGGARGVAFQGAASETQPRFTISESNCSQLPPVLPEDEVEERTGAVQ